MQSMGSFKSPQKPRYIVVEVEVKDPQNPDEKHTVYMIYDTHEEKFVGKVHYNLKDAQDECGTYNDGIKPSV